MMEKIEQKAKAAIKEAIDEPPAKSVGKLAEKAEETKEKVEQKAKTAIEEPPSKSSIKATK